MSTRWQIAAKLANGQCGCIYVHCDGYPAAALVTLKQHYVDQSKIDALIALGDCLSVHGDLAKCDTFSSRADEVWEEIKPTYGDSLEAVAEEHRHGDEEYRYFWDGKTWEKIEF